jgi:type IV pilus assembly protein PilX
MNTQYIKQRGAVLLLALVLLMAASILALSGLNSSAMQGRMVAATADSVTALSSAEMALKRAELTISLLSLADINNFNNAAPLYSKGLAATGNEVFVGSEWAGGTAVTDNPSGIEDGIYIIELMNDAAGYTDEQIIKANNILGASDNDGGNIFNGGANKADAGLYTFHTFRVVAKGYGRSSNTVRVVEAYYRKGFLN